jgi:polyphosphate kinase 2 (PPK2 family)
MLIRSGIILIKYWFSISDDEQQRRFERRLNTPSKHWKLSPMDLQSIARWEDYSRAKDDMFGFSDIPEAPWHVVHADDKKRARLNCISHLLSLIEYDTVPAPALELPKRPREKSDYTRPPLHHQRFVPDWY